MTSPSPRHPRARWLHGSRLLDGVVSFEQLEARLSSLSIDKDKGDAFEIFVEAYLTTQRKEVATVQPFTTIDLATKQSLNFLPGDCGADGIYHSVLGDLHAYQVKFRTGRPSLVWKELSKFYGLTESRLIAQRVLITNCDQITEVATSRTNHFAIRGTDFDRMEAEDFDTIRTWLAGASVRPARLRPERHQEKALSHIVPALQTEPRVTPTMACGTGKTMVGLWTAERLDARRILVLLPSLALLRQTLHEWMQQTSRERLPFLCVCSDPTIADSEDSFVADRCDLDFSVTTSPSHIRTFIEAAYDGPTVIFSTYQSADKVAAGMPPGEAFDLGIFDEAHKTAGRDGSNYRIALRDENLPIRKRLFLTATPRHYAPHRKGIDEDATPVFSMDNPDVYGRRAYTLTFGEAAREEIICRYKIIVSIITSEMVNDSLLHAGQVLIDGSEVPASVVARQIALRDAVEKYGVKKIFTFHKSVASAQEFVADRAPGIGTHLPDFATFHVNGRIPTAQREHRMRDFRAAPRAIMTNARCLTEGVDVPSVDMVAFLSPRRSRVDIVQATGRAMRRSEATGKEVGYVLVPLFVETATGESIEEAVSRTSFDEIWDILQSLQEQDEVLADVIHTLGQQKGRGRPTDTGFADRIDFLGPTLHLAELMSAVSSRCLEGVLSTWDEWFGKLVQFKERFGDCNVLTRSSVIPGLASWVSAQRVRFKKGQLGEDRTRRLEALGFDWDYQQSKRDATWMEHYRELESYFLEHRSSDMPRTHANRRLANWVWKQRSRRRGANPEGPLSDRQIILLDKLKFSWEPHRDRWEERFQALKNLRDQHGHCIVEEFADIDEDLLQWSNSQRKDRQQNELSIERIQRLDEIGFVWTSQGPTRKWLQNYEKLKRYHETHHDCDVPSRWKEDPALANWVSSQRTRRKSNEISDEEIGLLDNLDFTWQHRERGTWEDNLGPLREYKARHGHCDVPVNYSDPRLGRFVNSMRTQKKKGILSPERIALLEAEGFQWSATGRQTSERGVSRAWTKRFEALLAYKRIHGDCDVPTKWTDDPSLGAWVSNQRQAYYRDKLLSEQIRLLQAEGFIWSKHQR